MKWNWKWRNYDPPIESTVFELLFMFVCICVWIRLQKAINKWIVMDVELVLNSAKEIGENIGGIEIYIWDETRMDLIKNWDCG